MDPINLKLDRPTLSIIFLIALVGIFLLGRFSVSHPPKDVVCKKEMKDLEIAEAAVDQLESDLELQKDLLKKCEDGCDTRIRTRVDRKDTEQKEAVAEAKRKQKARYVEFKCRQCVRKGLCK